VATIKDVAEAAGVSRATVSRVLNGHPWVSEKTRQLVLEAVKRTNYHPNNLARSLRLKTPRSIGVLVSNPYGSAYEDVFFVRVALGIGREAETRGYTMTFATLSSPEDAPEMVQAKTVGGLVLAGITNNDSPPQFVSKTFPTVIIGKHYPKLQRPHVLVDNKTALKRATRYLIQTGHERIAIVIGPRRLYAFADRLAGYREALLEAGYPYSEDLVVELPRFTVHTGFEAYRILLAMPQKPTAALICDSAMSSGALQARALFPSGLELVTYGDPETLGIAAPLAVTTLRLSANEIGAAAARLLIDAIEGQDPPKEVSIVPEIHVVS